MMHFVYMLLCENNKIYTGYTTDVKARFQAHLNGTKKAGAKFTNANKPIKIIYEKEFETKSEAMKEEYRIKHLSRDEKLKLIQEQTSTLEDC